MTDCNQDIRNLDFNFFDASIALMNVQQIGLDAVIKQFDRAVTKDRMLVLVAEPLDPYVWSTHLRNIFDYLCTSRPGLKIVLWLDNLYKHDVKPLEQLHVYCDEVIFIDHNLARTWCLLIDREVSGCNSEWRSDREHFLFLPGKPFKPNRIRLFWKLLQKGFRDRMIWSLAVPNQDEIDRCRVFLPELDDKQYNDFLANNIRILDRNEIMRKTFYPGMPYDVDLFSNSLFRVISETECDSLYFAPPRATEKTWIAIYNRLPFIMSSQPKGLGFLENLGVDPYRDFLAIPNPDDPDRPGYLDYRNTNLAMHYLDWQKDFGIFYQNYKDPAWPVWRDLDTNYRHEVFQNYTKPIDSDVEQRLDAIVENSDHFFRSLREGKDIVRKITETNHQCFMDLGCDEYIKTKDMLRRHSFNVDAHDVLANTSELYRHGSLVPFGLETEE